MTMLAVALTFGRAWGQAPSAPTGGLERAEGLVHARAFKEAARMLRSLVSSDPANRRAKELLAFDLESMGDLKGERAVRSALAAEHPDDPRIQADYGRVLERSGDAAAALRAYRRARELSADRQAPELDAAIERMRGRSALEVETPVALGSDPEATASRVRAGAAVPVGSGRHLAFLGTHDVAERRSGPGATSSDALALTFVQRNPGGTSWAMGPRLHLVSTRGGAREDLGVGGTFEGETSLGPSLEIAGRADVETPWDEAPVTVLRGGRTTAAEGHVYARAFSRRLLLQAGARRRELSILASVPEGSRPRAWQSLWIAGADMVLWRKPGAALRGEMLDEAMIAPAGLSSAMTLAYRHYDVTTRTSPEFGAVIGLVPRGLVDEGSVSTMWASRRGNLGLELRAGLARDAAREARMWRAGGGLIWAPTPATRLELGYEGASEAVSGLIGQRRAGGVSFHVDL